MNIQSKADIRYIMYLVMPWLYLILGIACLFQLISVIIVITAFCFMRAIQSFDEYYQAKEKENKSISK